MLLYPIAPLDHPVCSTQVPIGYSTEFAELQYGPSYSGHTSTPLRRLWTILFAADLITGINVFRALYVWGKAEVEVASSATNFQIPDLISSFCGVCDLAMAAAKNLMRFKGSAESSRESHDCIV